MECPHCNKDLPPRFVNDTIKLYACCGRIAPLTASERQKALERCRNRVKYIAFPVPDDQLSFDELLAISA